LCKHGARTSTCCLLPYPGCSLQAKQAELSASATKKAVQLKASTKQLDKLKKDVAKLGEGLNMGWEVGRFRVPLAHVRCCPTSLPTCIRPSPLPSPLPYPRRRQLCASTCWHTACKNYRQAYINCDARSPLPHCVYVQLLSRRRGRSLQADDNL
jgi:hypothetical protein